MKCIPVKPTTALARRSTTSRQIKNPGVAKLRKDADDKILQNSTQIASALVKGATEGNASSARLLVDLADGANITEHTESVATVISLALNEWKKEPAAKEPETVELDITTNPPKLPQPEPRRLTDGNDQES